MFAFQDPFFFKHSNVTRANIHRCTRTECFIKILFLLEWLTAGIIWPVLSCTKGSHNLAYPDRITGYYMVVCCFQLAVYYFLLGPKASWIHPIIRSNDICRLQLKKRRFVTTATQSEVSEYKRISEDCVMNHFHRHRGGCCLGLWKWIDRVLDIYGSLQGCFIASVISSRVWAF